MPELRRCRGTWAYCDGDCSRCTTTATTQTSMVYLIQPTADVPERNVGKWIKVGDNSYRCSVCDEVSCCNGNFCPDCGADMRKETEDAN